MLLACMMLVGAQLGDGIKVDPQLTKSVSYSMSPLDATFVDGRRHVLNIWVLGAPGNMEDSLPAVRSIGGIGTVCGARLQVSLMRRFIMP